MNDTIQAPPRNGTYLDVEGVPTYYEVTGTGEPLLLLHGGLAAAESFDPQVGTLAGSYRVHVPERWGHGRTPDIDGPLTYEGMAQHTIGFMDQLGLESANLAGWSDGALVALLVAMRRPKLVRKLVLIDQFVTLDGAVPVYEAFMAAFSPEAAPPGIEDLYGALSPDGPEHFPVVFEKLHHMWTQPTGIDVADLVHIVAPTLILNGDAGVMSLAHADEVRQALPESQLAIVPGTSHGLSIEKPHIVNQLILDFLADEQTPKLFSLVSEEDC